jgi:hypothetical protein
MEKGIISKTFVYFLVLSFLLMVQGFPGMVAQAKELGRPLGEMVSKGEVKFEAREKVWREVDPSHFPILQGVKIKTEKGTSNLVLTNNCQIEVGENSLLSFDAKDRLHLVQGSIHFRIPITTEIEFKIGSILVTKYRPLQASKNPVTVLPKNEETIGSISIHSNGAVTLKSIQGSLSVLSEERVVLASLSPKETVTLPSVIVKTPSRAMVAQAGETAKEVEEKEKRSREAVWWWIGGGVAAAGVAAGLGIGLSKKDHHKDYTPICP